MRMRCVFGAYSVRIRCVFGAYSVRTRCVLGAYRALSAKLLMGVKRKKGNQNVKKGMNTEKWKSVVLFLLFFLGGTNVAGRLAAGESMNPSEHHQKKRISKILPKVRFKTTQRANMGVRRFGDPKEKRSHARGPSPDCEPYCRRNQFLHHPRNPGMIRFPCKYQQTSWFRMVSFRGAKWTLSIHSMGRPF